MRVKAIRVGYFGHSLRKVGDVFEISNEIEFSKNWMEYLDKPTLSERSEPKKSSKSMATKKAVKEEKSSAAAESVI